MAYLTQKSLVLYNHNNIICICGDNENYIRKTVHGNGTFLNGSKRKCMMGEEIRLYSLSFGWLCSQEGGRGWGWATPGHTAGRLSEQGLSATGLEKVGVLSYLAYCLLFRRYFHQVKKNCISEARMYLL